MEEDAAAGVLDFDGAAELSGSVRSTTWMV